MAQHKYIAVRNGLILPKENGGTVTLSKGQTITGPFYAKYVGLGLEPAVAPPPPKPAGPEGVDPSSHDKPKGEEVARSKPEPEPEPEPEPVVEPEPEEEFEEDGDSLPSSVEELEAMSKADLQTLAEEQGLSKSGTKAELIERIADDLEL